jgi:hypothetical protein
MAKKKAKRARSVRSAETPIISFRLSTQTLAEVDARAKEYGITRSKLAATLLTQALARRLPKARGRIGEPFPPIS